MEVADDLVKAIDGVQEEAGCSEADVSEALKGNTDSLHTAEIVNIESSTSSNSRSNLTSLSTSSLTSSDMDDIPLNRVYENVNKRLSPSPSTKTHKKPDSDTFVPMYPFVVERIHDMQQRRIDACVRLPDDHPLQPSMIEPIQLVPADAEGVNDQTGSESANIDVSSSPMQTTETHEPSIIQGLINHYSGELPGYETNLEKASDIASDEVMTESPQKQTPNSEMASLTQTNFVIITEQIHPEPDVPEQMFLNYLFLNKLFLDNQFLNKMFLNYLFLNKLSLTNLLQPTLFLNQK